LPYWIKDNAKFAGISVNNMSKSGIKDKLSKITETKAKDDSVLYSDITGGLATKLINAVNRNLSNKQKIELLREIIQDNGFAVECKNAENKTITKVFNTVRKTDIEYADNINGAKSLNNSGYNVYVLPKFSGSKSFDYILEKENKIYTAELKTIYGNNSLNNRLNAANEQTDRIVLNIVGNSSSRYVSDEIRGFYLSNPHIKEIIVLKGGKPIYIRYEHVAKKNFTRTFMDLWAR